MVKGRNPGFINKPGYCVYDTTDEASLTGRNEMFKVFGYDDMYDFEFFVFTEEEAKSAEEKMVMCVVFYEDADAEFQRIVHIGKKAGVRFDSGRSLNYYLNKTLDALEGKEMYASDLTYCLNYKNELMSKEDY